MHPVLASLVAIQQLDAASDAIQKRLAEVPATEAALTARVDAAAAARDAVKTRLADNQTSRRALEKDVAGVDSRLARFSDHKAQVKTNQEYTALLHEISTATAEKDAIEEKILVLMEEADGLGRELKTTEDQVAVTRKESDAALAELRKSARALTEELRGLEGKRKGEAAGLPPQVLARYEQRLKQRKGVAVAAMRGESCSACHVRLRPHVAQQIRRNEDIVECESCQRILYYDPPADPGAPR